MIILVHFSRKDHFTVGRFGSYVEIFMILNRLWFGRLGVFHRPEVAMKSHTLNTLFLSFFAFNKIF